MMGLDWAASFGTIPILVKFAYAIGRTPVETLAFRFLCTAAGLTALATTLRQGPPRLGGVRLLNCSGSAPSAMP
jgi:hypothetical protein